jgi:hypothetical protein
MRCGIYPYEMDLVLDKMINGLLMTISAFLLYLFFDWFYSCNVNLIYAKNTAKILYRTDKLYEITLEELLKEKCPLLSDPTQNYFYVHPFLQSGHLQTIWNSFLGNYFFKPRVSYTRELISTKDNGVISLDWTEPPSNISSGKQTPYVIITHGLTGGSEEGISKLN